MERQETGGKVFSDLKMDRPTCVRAPSMRALARLRRSGPVSFSACVFFLRRPGSLRRGLLPALLFLPLLAGLVPGAVAQTQPCTNCVWITGGATVDEGGNAVFTVNVNPAPTMAEGNMRVPLVVDDSPGNSVSDVVLFKHEGYKEVTVPVNQSAVTYTVPTRDDMLDEPDGSVRARIWGTPRKADDMIYPVSGGGFFYRNHGPQGASVTVRDNDEPPPPMVSFQESAVSVDEYAGMARLKLVLSKPAQPVNNRHG